MKGAASSCTHPNVELIDIPEEALDQLVAAAVVQQQEPDVGGGGESRDLISIEPVHHTQVHGVGGPLLLIHRVQRRVEHKVVEVLRALLLHGIARSRVSLRRAAGPADAGAAGAAARHQQLAHFPPAGVCRLAAQVRLKDWVVLRPHNEEMQHRSGHRCRSRPPTPHLPVTAAVCPLVSIAPVAASCNIADRASAGGPPHTDRCACGVSPLHPCCLIPAG